jgi:hypothetical protein
MSMRTCAIRQLKAGHTFVTTGAMLEFSVNGNERFWKLDQVERLVDNRMKQLDQIDELSMREIPGYPGRIGICCERRRDRTKVAERRGRREMHD